MSEHLDHVPLSGIVRIRDMMYSIESPFRLDQGDISFDAPDSVKEAMRRAVDENRTHYVQTAGIPRLLDLIAEKLRRKNGVPVESADEVMVTNGGIHALYLAWQALLEPGDEVLVPDPEWPPCVGGILASRGTPVACPLYESRGWRYDLDELESKLTARTRAIYLNSPHNPTGGVLTRGDLERICEIVRARDLWLISDEAYEDVVYDSAAHVSPASLPEMYARTLVVYTFSKSYAMTGLRLGYVAVNDARLRERMKTVLFQTTSNVASVVQHGGIGALDGPQDCLARFRQDLLARRDLFYAEIGPASNDILQGEPPRGAFYAFVKIAPDWPAAAGCQSISWKMSEFLIERARIGCVPGVDFGAHGEGYLRFCFARGLDELRGALDAMRATFRGG